MNALRPHVPVSYASIAIKQEDRVIRNPLNDSPKTPFCLRERLFGFATFGNVAPQGTFDLLALLDFDIEGFTCLLKGDCLFINRVKEALTLTPQILEFVLSGNILGSCNKVARIVLIKDGGDMASDPQACAILQSNIVVKQEAFAGSQGIAKQVDCL